MLYYSDGYAIGDSKVLGSEELSGGGDDVPTQVHRIRRHARIKIRGPLN